MSSIQFTDGVTGQVRTAMSLVGGARGDVPANEMFYHVVASAYDASPPTTLPGGWRLVHHRDSANAYINDADRTIIIGLRGTKWAPKELLSKAHLLIGDLRADPKYNQEWAFVTGVLADHPGYDVFLGGHSLGGAMVTQLKKDIPALKHAVTFNSAVSPGQTQDADIHRVYDRRDPLYVSGGYRVADEVIDTGAADPFKAHSWRTFQDHYTPQLPAAAVPPRATAHLTSSRVHLPQRVARSLPSLNPEEHDDEDAGYRYFT